MNNKSQVKCPFLGMEKASNVGKSFQFDRMVNRTGVRDISDVCAG